MAKLSAVEKGPGITRLQAQAHVKMGQRRSIILRSYIRLGEIQMASCVVGVSVKPLRERCNRRRIMPGTGSDEAALELVGVDFDFCFCGADPYVGRLVLACLEECGNSGLRHRPHLTQRIRGGGADRSISVSQSADQRRDGDFGTGTELQ